MFFGNIKRLIKTVMLVGLIVGITHFYYEFRVGSSLNQISEQLEELAEDRASFQGSDDLESFASEIFERLLASIQRIFSNSSFSITSNQQPQPERS